MSWGSTPKILNPRSVEGWGGAPVVAPQADPVQGWFPLENLNTGVGAASGQAVANLLVPQSGIGNASGAALATLLPVNIASVGNASGVGVGSASVPSFAPTLSIYDVVGTFTYNIPWWANYLDLIALGGGGGGKGLGLVGVWGNGGRAGGWGLVTLQRGNQIPWTTTTLSVTVGGGGSGGSSSGGNGGDGGGSSVVGYVGGAGGAGSTTTGLDANGNSPGNQTWNGVQYNGGGSVGALTNGDPPGGGGGGSTVTLTAGRPGARGQVWIRAYQ